MGACASSRSVANFLFREFHLGRGRGRGHVCDRRGPCMRWVQLPPWGEGQGGREARAPARPLGTASPGARRMLGTEPGVVDAETAPLGPLLPRMVGARPALSGWGRGPGRPIGLRFHTRGASALKEGASGDGGCRQAVGDPRVLRTCTAPGRRTDSACLWERTCRGGAATRMSSQAWSTGAGSREPGSPAWPRGAAGTQSSHPAAACPAVGSRVRGRALGTCSHRGSGSQIRAQRPCRVGGARCSAPVSLPPPARGGHGPALGDRGLAEVRVARDRHPNAL